MEQTNNFLAKNQKIKSLRQLKLQLQLALLFKMKTELILKSDPENATPEYINNY